VFFRVVVSIHTLLCHICANDKYSIVVGGGHHTSPALYGLISPPNTIDKVLKLLLNGNISSGLAL